VKAWALAIRQSPIHSSWWDFFRIRSYAFLGEYARALELADEAMRRADSPQNKMSLLVSTAFVHAERNDEGLGDLALARAQMQRAVELSPTLNQRMWVSFYRYQKKEDLDRFMAAMEKAGMPE
jgi:tetratricopeptide (TPR) repeat protein